MIFITSVINLVVFHRVKNSFGMLLMKRLISLLSSIDSTALEIRNAASVSFLNRFVNSLPPPTRMPMTSFISSALVASILRKAHTNLTPKNLPDWKNIFEHLFWRIV